MLIRLGYELIFECTSAATPMVLMLFVHTDRQGDLVHPDSMVLEPVVPVSEFTDAFGNRCARLIAPQGTLRIAADTLIRDSGQPEPAGTGMTQLPVQELPSEVLPYLMSSRYCEVDRLSQIAWDLFAHTYPGWERVMAISAWVHNHVRFGYRFARVNKTAVDVYTERTGVCRDFMHLAITFCRAMNIPARYATGYLGEIGVPETTEPDDFSAFFEVYLGGQWWPVDARYNMPRIGRVLMARGRDATDVALTTSFGATRLVKFKVWTDEVKDEQPRLLGIAA